MKDLLALSQGGLGDCAFIIPPQHRVTSRGIVTPAQAGVQEALRCSWIPAPAGITRARSWTLDGVEMEMVMPARSGELT